MIKVYKCYDENNNEDYALELWQASTKYPDTLMYFSDWKDKSNLFEMKYQIFQWLCYCASHLTFPFYAKELVEYALENWCTWEEEEEEEERE